MHLLDKTVHNAITTGVLIGGLGLAFVIWFLSYQQAKVDAFMENSSSVVTSQQIDSI